jgi:tetratricopeptide (TPR) repeat protein
MRALRAAVLERVPAEQVLRYDADWPDEGGPALDEEALAAAFVRLLGPKLEAVIATRTMARAVAAAGGRDATAEANAAFEAERAAHVAGRDAELERLAAYLSGEAGTGLPLVVAGVAGSGKSTLLAEAAARARVALPGAAILVRYCGVTPGTEGLVALLTDLRAGMARAFGLPEPATLSDENQLVAAVAAELATVPATAVRPLLLVIDALDQLGAHTQRTDWLPPHLAPHVRVVVSVLAGRSEFGYLSARLPAEQLLSLAPLGVEAGREMLRDLLAAAPARVLNPAQEDAVLTAFAVEGLPLHLRLLAAEARGWRAFDRPRLGEAPLPTTTPELLAVLLERLEAPERNGLALVARSLGDLAAARVGLAEDELLDLLSRDETVRSAQRALSPYSPPVDPTLPLPASLWARLHGHVAPLLTERLADGGVRLLTFYHGQLRAVVEERYLAGAERAARHRELAHYFDTQPWRWGSRQWNWRKVRELVTQLEWAGDRAAAEQALGGLAEDMERSPVTEAQEAAGTYAVIRSLRDHLESAGYWRVGLRLYEQVLAAARATGNRSAEGQALGNMGLLAGHLGDADEATRAYSQALALLRAAGNRADEGSTLNNLGILSFRRGNLGAAEEYFRQALAIRAEVGDRAGEGVTLNNMGQVAGMLGRSDAAAGYHARALAIRREVGDRAGEAVTLSSLGQLAYHLGRADEAASYYQQALVILRAVGDLPREAHVLSSLGSLEARLGRWEEARRHFERALEIQRGVGDRAAEGTTLTNLGALAVSSGRWEEAASAFEQALGLLRAVGDRAGEAHALNSLGSLARDQGRLDEAAEYLAGALALLRAVGDRPAEGTLLNNMGALARDQGRLDEAAQYYAEALTILREVGDRAAEGNTLSNLGALIREHERFAEAARYFEQALAIRREVGDRLGEAVTLTNLGVVARDQSQFAEAAQYYTQALAICEEIGAVDVANTVRTNIAYLEEQQRGPD